MTGFFTEDELEYKTQIQIKTAPSCGKCKLNTRCRSPKMPHSGKGEKSVLIVTEAPNDIEDQRGIRLSDTAGNLLRTTIEKFGLNLEKDFYITSALCCKPTTKTGTSKSPSKITKSELKYCKPLLDNTIKELNPQMIWLLGDKTLESFYTGRFSRTAINRWRKLCIPDRKIGKWVIPLFSPEYVCNNEYDKNLRATFKRDLKWALSCIGKDFPDFSDENKQIKKLSALDQIEEILKAVLKKAGGRDISLYFDYETNSLKSQWPLSRIASISFMVRGEQVAYSFPYCYQDYFDEKERRKIKSLWRKILVHPNIGLIAHNIKFEDSFSRNIFGIRPINWIADTMLTAHILDNRRAYTGLKFQSYIWFGVEPYNRQIEKYLKSEGDSPYNRVDEIDLGELLLYGGLDSYFGMQLYEKQLESTTLSPNLYPKNKFPQANTLFREGTLALSDIQENGIHIDVEYYQKENIRLGKKIDRIKRRLNEGDEAQQFEGETGRKLDLASNPDLGVLFYDILGAPKQLTPKGNYSAAKESIENIDLPFVKDLLQLRKMEKIKNTYFAQLLREVGEDGKIHGMFDLNIPISFRSSSSLPNWQNMPSHDEEAGRYVRMGVIPSPGNKLVEIDYDGIEVKVASIITKDSNLRTYCTNSQSDMHRDSSCDIWMIPKEEVTKVIRFHSKGSWVFAQFYGSFFRQCAVNLWKNVDLKTTSGITLRQNLKDNKIYTFNEFTEHCKEVERIFWQDRFGVYAQWKKDIVKLFRKKSYIETPLGFRYTGNLNEREICNYPIQGTAFALLLSSLIRINKIAKEEKWRSKLVGQVHDSILIDLHPKEQEHVLKICIREMTIKTREIFSWVDIPIPAEISISKINGNWWEMDEIDAETN